MANLVDLAHASASEQAYHFIIADSVPSLKRHCPVAYQDGLTHLKNLFSSCAIRENLLRIVALPGEDQIRLSEHPR
jgi:hypothetical protein